ncbi:MAG: sigma-54-dependent Fis family transcriptional regulator [Xanthomonadaceae bacterium]|nr:sigma-54-dependent Fis family transcriptional regulator [Xanthomonadaceae bacterium]
MQKRKILYLSPQGSAWDQLAVLASAWNVRTATPDSLPCLEEYQVGLVELADGRWHLSELEQILSRGAIEWIALMPAEDLGKPELAQLVLRYCVDFHTLPVHWERLNAVIGHAFGMSALREAFGDHGPPVQHRMVGRSRAMHALMAAIGKIANVEAPVLIQGESGTGKELAAQAIHDNSRRSGGPFVAVNCGALPASLIQSELFGYERGAFTGAQRRKIGRIEAANGGTIFLDEIGDLDLELQANLLRFLQEGVIERLGGSGSVPVDVRVIAATHVNLELAVAEGRFRADLYYRLNVLRLDMPPLRARAGDVAVLADYFFERYAKDKAPGVRGFSREAYAAMEAHTWPGNVRELINRVRRAMVMCEGRLIRPADLGLRDSQDAPLSLVEVRENAERMAVEAALQACRYNVSKAASQLGTSRVTLYRLMRKYALDAPPAGSVIVRTGSSTLTR